MKKGLGKISLKGLLIEILNEGNDFRLDKFRKKDAKKAGPFLVPTFTFLQAGVDLFVKHLL